MQQISTDLTPVNRRPDLEGAGIKDGNLLDPSNDVVEKTLADGEGTVLVSGVAIDWA